MEVEEAKKLLISDDGTPSPQYQAYLQYAKLATDKQKAMDEARQAASQNFSVMRNWPITGKTYSDEVQQAKDQWATLGHKNEIEQAITVLRAAAQDVSFLKSV